MYTYVLCRATRFHRQDSLAEAGLRGLCALQCSVPRAPLALLPCELQAGHSVGLRLEMAPVWGFLDARAFTALFEADVLVHFVDSSVPVSEESCVKLESRAECCPAASARLLAPTGHCAAV